MEKWEKLEYLKPMVMGPNDKVGEAGIKRIRQWYIQRVVPDGKTEGD